MGNFNSSFIHEYGFVVYKLDHSDALKSGVQFQKCCSGGNISVFDGGTKLECIYEYLAINPNSDPHLSSSPFEISRGLPCLHENSILKNDSDFVARIGEFSTDGTIMAYLYENESKRFKPGQYCLHTNTGAPEIIICRSSEFFPFWISVVFVISVLLIILTLILHLVTPELRKKIKDKCFIYYLGSLVVSLILFGEFFTEHFQIMRTNLITNLKEQPSKKLPSLYISAE